jgi:hypothetical protein
MLRALAFLSVWQQHHQAAKFAPFGFGAGDELVDDDLRTVREIPKLGLPNR